MASRLLLQECLCLVEKRETRYRVQWYYRLFEETQRGLTRAPSLDAVHGSLLALGELLRHTGACACGCRLPTSSVSEWDELRVSVP